jgi:hypothetical protein
LLPLSIVPSVDLSSEAFRVPLTVCLVTNFAFIPAWALYRWTKYFPSAILCVPVLAFFATLARGPLLWGPPLLWALMSLFEGNQIDGLLLAAASCFAVELAVIAPPAVFVLCLWFSLHVAGRAFRGPPTYRANQKLIRTCVRWCVLAGIPIAQIVWKRDAPAEYPWSFYVIPGGVPAAFAVSIIILLVPDLYAGGTKKKARAPSNWVDVAIPLVLAIAAAAVCTALGIVKWNPWMFSLALLPPLAALRAKKDPESAAAGSDDE